MRKLAITSALLLGTSFAHAGGPTTSLSTEYLMTMDLSFDALNSVGRRIVVNVSSGSVQWPNIIGIIIPPAG